MDQLSELRSVDIILKIPVYDHDVCVDLKFYSITRRYGVTVNPKRSCPFLTPEWTLEFGDIPVYRIKIYVRERIGKILSYIRIELVHRMETLYVHSLLPFL